jgi:hypothetical protein
VRTSTFCATPSLSYLGLSLLGLFLGQFHPFQSFLNGRRLDRLFQHLVKGFQSLLFRSLGLLLDLYFGFLDSAHGLILVLVFIGIGWSILVKFFSGIEIHPFIVGAGTLMADSALMATLSFGLHCQCLLDMAYGFFNGRGNNLFTYF